MIEYILLVALGALAGSITGLVPGVHPNTVVFGSFPAYFAFDVDFLAYMSFISGMAVSHTFHDFLPSIFLGAPGPETAIASLPGHRLMRRGRGLEAFRYTVVGGMVASTMLLAILPLLFLLLERMYVLLEPAMEYILLFFLLVPLISSQSIRHAVTVTTLSAILGVAVLSLPVNQQYALMPVFTGLFAVPSLVFLIGSGLETPVQAAERVETKSAVRGGFTGFLAGTLAGVFPGIGGAISTYILAPVMEDEDRDFMSAMGAVNTTDALMSFLTLMILGRARSGPALALQALAPVNYPSAFFLLGCSFLAVAFSAPLALKVSGRPEIQAVNLQGLAVPVLILVLLLSLYLAGFLGVLMLAVSSAIGFMAAVTSQRRMCMSVLIVPAILFFAGIDIFI